MAGFAGDVGNASLNNQPSAFAHTNCQIVQNAFTLLLINYRAHLCRPVHLVSDTHLFHSIHTFVNKLFVDATMHQPARSITADLPSVKRNGADQFGGGFRDIDIIEYDRSAFAAQFQFQRREIATTCGLPPSN